MQWSKNKCKYAKSTTEAKPFRAVMFWRFASAARIGINDPFVN